MSLCQSVMNVEGTSKWANDGPIMWPEMVYGRPGKCLDCNPTVLPRWGLGIAC